MTKSNNNLSSAEHAHPLSPPEFEPRGRNTQQPPSPEEQMNEEEHNNMQQEEDDSNTLKVGQTVYGTLEGEFHTGYLISIQNGDSSDPLLTGILFKEEALDMINESPISPNMMGTTTIGSLGLGCGNLNASSETNNVPYVETGTQQEVDDSNTPKAGQTVYGTLEGEFQVGYWINVQNGDSVDPHLTGILFKEETLDMMKESPISPNMMGMAIIGSLGLGYGNPSTSSEMNNVPCVEINTQQEGDDSNTPKVGQTVYGMLEGEFQAGYWISVQNGDSSDPPLTGIIFKEEALDIINESPISPNMMDIAIVGSLGLGYGNPSASSEMNNVPYVETITQQKGDESNTPKLGQTVYGMLEGEFQAGYWISVQNGDSSDPPLTGILFKEEALDMINESPISPSMMDIATVGSLGLDYGNPSASSEIIIVPYMETTALGMNGSSLEKEKNISEEIDLKRPSPGALMALPHLGSGTRMAFDIGNLVDEVIKKIKVGPYFDMMVDEVLKTIKARPDFANVVACCDTLDKNSSGQGQNENVIIDLEKVERHIIKKDFPFFSPAHSESPSKRTKLMQDETNEELGKQNKGHENKA